MSLFFHLLRHIIIYFFHSIMTIWSQNEFQRAKSTELFIFKYFIQLLHLSILLQLSFANGISCSKTYSRKNIKFLRLYFNQILQKYSRFSKYYFSSILVFIIYVKYLISSDKRNENINNKCIESIYYKLFFASFLKHYDVRNLLIEKISTI